MDDQVALMLSGMGSAAADVFRMVKVILKLSDHTISGLTLNVLDY